MGMGGLKPPRYLGNNNSGKIPDTKGEKSHSGKIPDTYVVKFIGISKILGKIQMQIMGKKKMFMII